MNKKVNTVLFILGATIVNVILMIVIFLALFVLFGRFLAPNLSAELNQIILLLLFVGSIVATYFIYHRLVKLLSEKFNMDNYFDPIFKSRKK